MSGRPIGDYGVLSDSHSAALVSRDRSLDWLCFPRFDAPSVFARLLDDPAGHWSLRPARDGYSVTRRYLEGTMILETTFTTADGTLVVTDAMPFAHTSDDRHDLGTDAPHAVVRRVRCTGDTVDVAVEYLGLLAGEVGPDGELLGNSPQAFSHVGLVNAAWTIAEVERRGSASAVAARTAVGA